MSTNTERDERLRIASQQAAAILAADDDIRDEFLDVYVGNIEQREKALTDLTCAAFDVADALIRHADETTETGEGDQDGDEKTS